MRTPAKFIVLLAAIAGPLGLLTAAPAGAALPTAERGAEPTSVMQPQVDLMLKTPYLIYPGVVGQMEVLWQLSSSYTSTFEWGTDLSYSLSSVQNNEYNSSNQHAYTITGLLPATKYYYRVTTYGVSYTGSFVSAPAGDATQLKFLAYGDTRSYPDQHNLEATALQGVINADPAYQTFSLFMGDYVLNGCTESYWSSEWFSFAYPSIRTLTANLPYAGCMGNHETYPSGTTLFPKYFPYPFAGSRYYYSFDYGPIHVTVLDVYTAYDSTSTQGQWFKNDLAGSTKPWKFVLLHEPGWAASNSCGTGHTNNTTVQSQVEPFCERYGVAAVFAGHSHYYARAVVNGIQHVTTGGGGAPLNTGCTGQPNEVAYASAYNYCKVAINGGVLQFQAINRSTGALIDSFTLVRTIADVTPPVVAVTSPVGGEDWKAGSSHAIAWTATDNVGVGSVDLAWSPNGGASFPNAIAMGIANSGSYAWTVPNAPGGTARVRVTAHDAAGNVGADSSAANFAISTWTITASAGTGGILMPTGAVPVVEGANQHFTILPAPGYHVATLTVDGGAVASDTTYTFMSVTADHTIGATFSTSSYAVIVDTVGAGSVARDPDQPAYPYGTRVQLTATPRSGWAFSAWSGDTTGTDNPVTVTVTGPKQITATFVDIQVPTVAVTAPVGGERWMVGSLQNIMWTANDNVGVDSVGVECSLGGVAGPWLPVAHGLANSGSFGWTLPIQASDSALVRVTAYDHAGNTGSARSDSSFHIVDYNVGMWEGGAAVLALARPLPTPSRGTTLLRFSLPQAGSARLEILDLGGRRLWVVEGSFAAGPQSCRWDGMETSGARAGAGLYFVRLATQWGIRTQRLVWLQ